MAADESHVYWTNDQANTIGRANLDGSEANEAFIRGVSRPGAIAVDDGHIYWTDVYGIGRATLEGGEVESFIPGFGYYGVAVSAGYIFWGSREGAIGRARIDGSEVRSRLINGTGVVTALAANTGHLYWTNWYEGGKTLSTIGRANLDGTGVDEDWVTSNRRDGLSGIAVDARTQLSQLPLGSQPIRMGRVRHDRRTGVVLIDVSAWEGGELSVVWPKIGWKVLKPQLPVEAGRPVHWQLRLWPGRRGQAASHIRAQLTRMGRASITLRILYREPGKTAYTRRKRVAFMRTR